MNWIPDIQDEFNSISVPPVYLKPLVYRIDLQWFAAEDEGRTEDPTDFKLRKAREEGRVAKSQDLNGALVLLFGVITLLIMAPSMLGNLAEMLRFFFLRATEMEPDNPIIFRVFVIYFLRLFLPIAFTVVIAGIAGNLLQNGGFLYSVKPITPKFDKILPKIGQWLKRSFFSGEGLFNLAKSLFKVGILAATAFFTIRSQLPTLITTLTAGFWPSIAFVSGIAGRMLLTAAILFLVLAIPDYVFQRRQFIESLKMTKQEIKEEYKQLEGDPLVKSRLRQRMREILSQNMAVNVPKADVVITNPTHYAIAMQWDRATMRAPMCTAKGSDNLALRIRELARESGVPIVENKPLARALYAEVEIGDMIPDEYYQALAVILARVYALDSRKKSTVQGTW